MSSLRSLLFISPESTGPGLSGHTSPKTAVYLHSLCSQGLQLCSRASDAEQHTPQRWPPSAVAQYPIQTLDQVWGKQLEFLGPHRRAARHGDRAVALGDGLGLRRQRLADDLAPAALDARERRGGGQVGGHAGERGRQRAGTRAPHAAAAAPDWLSV